MAFSRLIYDENSYKHKLYESTSSGKYQILPESTYRGKDTCFQNPPEIRSKGFAVFPAHESNDLIDAESDLHNLIRKASKDPRTEYPYTKKTYSRIPTMSECSKDDLSRSYPLLEAPSFKRSQSIDVPRFQSLCLNPQQLNRIHSNFYIGAQTRLYNRDHYVPRIPKPLGATGLPEEKPGKPTMSCRCTLDTDKDTGSRRLNKVFCR